MMKSMKARAKAGNALIYAILSGLSFIWLLPIVWLIMSSFRKEPGAYTAYIIPKEFTLDNYTRLFTETTLFNYPRWFMNTLIVAIFISNDNRLTVLGLNSLTDKRRSLLITVSSILF